CGKPTPAVLPVGLDQQGDKVWFEWSSWNVARNSSNRNWYDDFSAEGLERVFPGFMRIASDATWAEPAKLAVYWYLEAGRIGNDSAMILLQAAFELLAWTALVQDGRALSKTQFEKLDAANKLQRLLTAFAVPTTVR